MKKILFIVLLCTLLTVIIYVYITFNKANPVDNKSTATNVSAIEKNPKYQTITLISTGDIGLVRDINDQIQKKQDPNYPFVKISQYLKNADFTVINLEGPLIKNCPITLTGFKFCGESTNVNGIVYAGVDAASVANNHSTNFGIVGLKETENSLRSNGIIPFGLENGIEYMEVRGKKIALVGFVELGNNWAGLNNAKVENVARLVSEANTNSDIVICAFHWGVEYTRKPTENQINIAHIAIDNGADIVLGNHAHWIQENEIYKNVFIAYAQGNTIFDQDWSQETKEGVIYKFEYKNDRFEKIDEKYTIIENNSQPRFATEMETKYIINKLKNTTI